MEYWSIEKEDFKPSAITPVLQYSNTPNLIEIKILPKDCLFWVHSTDNQRDDIDQRKGALNGAQRVL
jgi:hypothetical protein